jgi:hypothetical protein
VADDLDALDLLARLLQIDVLDEEESASQPFIADLALRTSGDPSRCR